MERIIDLRDKKELEPEPIPPSFDFPEPPMSENDARKQISWTGPLYFHNPDMKAVWTVFGVFMALALLFQFFQKNIITTVLMALIGIMIVVHAKKKPMAESEFIISPLGIKIGNETHGFKEIKSFWVDYRPDTGIEELSLQMEKWYMPYLKIPLNGQNPVQLRTFLIQFIPEAEHVETLGETIARRLGL